MSSPAANAKTVGSYSGVAADAETAPTVTAENAIKPVNKTEISFFIIFSSLLWKIFAVNAD